MSYRRHTLIVVSMAFALASAISSGAHAQPTFEDETAALAAIITVKLEGTEHWAVASGFPRHYVIAEIAKAVLVAVDGARAPGTIETAALDRVLSQEITSQARAALEIVRRETADD